MADVSIHTETIKLDQFLKLSDAVSGGGEAKIRVQAGDVAVNGEVETRRGRKLHPGDVAELDGRSFRVVAG
jgi:ribosome-associated protein